MDPQTFARLEALFDELTDLAPDERARRVEALRGTEPALADSLAALLDAPREGVDARVRDLASRAGDDSDHAERVGAYRLLGRIGEGGFGVVWLAEQREPIQRVVAIKVIKPGMDTRAVLARFRAEQQAMALLDHPSIVPAIEAGATAQGQPYIVMPLVPGMPITRYVQEKRADVRTVVGLMQGVARAIEHAHARGLIHRDIKPANILVATVDGQPVPRIIDFGLAKAMDRSLSDQSTLTLGGELLGTPEYMSPEQAEAKPLDVRTDVYAIGAVLYELLTGRAPIESERLRAAGRPDVVRRLILESPIQAPSALAPHVPRELDWICLRCLERDPARRYPTASALAEDLERFLAGLVIAAAPPSRWYRVRHQLWRSRLPLSAAGLVAAVLVAGSAVSLRMSLREREARVQAEEVITFWRGVLSGLDPAVSRGRDNTVMILQLDQARAQLQTAGLSPLTEQRTRQMLAEAYVAIGEFATARPIAERATELALSLWGPDDPRSIVARMVQYRCELETRTVPADARDDGRRSAEFQRFIQHALATVPSESPEWLRIAAELASMREFFNHSGPTSMLRTLIREAERRLGPDHRLTLRLMRSLASSMIREHEEGLEIMLEARRRAELKYGKDSIEASIGLGTEIYHMVHVRGAQEAYDFLRNNSGFLFDAVGQGSTPALITAYNMICLEIELSQYNAALLNARTWLHTVRRSRGVGSQWDDWMLGVLLACEIRTGNFDNARAVDQELRGRMIAKTKPGDRLAPLIDQEVCYYIAAAYVEAGKLREAALWSQLVGEFTPMKIDAFKELLKARGLTMEELAAMDPV